MINLNLLKQKLQSNLTPLELDIIDESAKHVGHAGYKAGEITHLRIQIVSDFFKNMTKVERHKYVYNLLAEEFAQGLHALALKTVTIEENNL